MFFFEAGSAIRSALTLSESELYRSAPSAEQEPTQWRKEVAHRVRVHRARRRRRIDPDASLDLQFDPPCADEVYATQSQITDEPALPVPPPMEEQHPGHLRIRADYFDAAGTGPADQLNIEETEDPGEILHSSGPARDSIDLTRAPIIPEVREPLAPFPRIKPRTPERKIIEFPRLNEGYAGSRNEPGEPIGDQLRIFEAMEEISAPEVGMLASIRLESDLPEPEPDEQKVDLPLPVATFERRGLAVGVDGLILCLAYSMFAATAFYLMKSVTFHKPMLTASAACCVLLFVAYHLTFLFYSTATPGMRAAGLVISDFSGAAPGKNRRAFRALALTLSCASLGLGLIWAFIDEDRLCWHDRMTHTYLRGSEG